MESFAIAQLFINNSTCNRHPSEGMQAKQDGTRIHWVQKYNDIWTRLSKVGLTDPAYTSHEKKQFPRGRLISC